MIARVLCATAQSEQAAVTMAELWGEQVGRFERSAPGFQGAVLLREGERQQWYFTRARSPMTVFFRETSWMSSTACECE